MKILLTGADGQLGHDFRKLFDKLRIKYIATDFKELDITDKKSINYFFKKNTHLLRGCFFIFIFCFEIKI